MVSRKQKSATYVAHGVFLWDSAAEQVTGRTKVTGVQPVLSIAGPCLEIVYLISTFIVGKLIGPSVNAAPQHC